MHILLIHNYYKNRGGEDIVFECEKEILRKNNYEIIAYCKNSRDIKKFHQKLVLFFNIFFSIKTIKELNSIVSEQKPVIAHIHNIFPLISPSVYFVLRKNRIPVIQTVHNYRFYCSNGLGLKNNRPCDKCLNLSFKNIFQICSGKKIYDFSLKIIVYFMRKLKIFSTISFFMAPSRFMKNSLLRSGISEEKIILKRNLICMSEHLPKNKHKKETYFTFFGRLSHEKGIMDLIEVFKGLNYINLKIFGDGPLQGRISMILKQEKMENIKLMGFTSGDTKYDFLYNASANIIPSTCNEVSPVILGECLKLGIPVIGSDLGSIPEFIKDGYNGYIYTSGDSDMLKDKIIRIYKMSEEKKRIIKKNCLESFNYFFDLNSNFEITRKLYAKLYKL